MNRKIIAGVTLGMLMVAFGAVSVLVVLSKRHPFLVEKKLKLGALILTLSGVISASGCGSPFAPHVMCYAPISYNQITIDRYDYSTGSIAARRTDTLTGAIDMRSDTAFSFGITDTTGYILFKDDLHPADGSFDESAEEFSIGIPASIFPGNYELRFYSMPKDSIRNGAFYLQEFRLTVTE
jgi:hypothetical protein